MINCRFKERWREMGRSDRQVKERKMRWKRQIVRMLDNREEKEAEELTDETAYKCWVVIPRWIE